MKMYEYCSHCHTFLGSAVWGMFYCPVCDAKLAVAAYAEELEEDEDE